jgi:hypothetical protein
MGRVGCGKCARLLLGEKLWDVLLHASLGICILQPLHTCMKSRFGFLNFCGFVSVLSIALIQKRDTLMGRLALCCSTCQFCTVTTIILISATVASMIYLQAHMRKCYRNVIGMDWTMLMVVNANTLVLFYAGNSRETLIETN